jgi:hypothetical protein
MTTDFPFLCFTGAACSFFCGLDRFLDAAEAGARFGFGAGFVSVTTV